MPGSFDLSPLPGSYLTNAAQILVARYNATFGKYTVLPNVYCLRIDYREGSDPPVARFQYITDDALAAASTWPNDFEELWPIDAKGSYVVLNDDRLVVILIDPEGNPLFLFDGFAQIPQVDIAASGQAITFAAIGTPIREFDFPLSESVWRDGDMPDDTTGDSDVYTNLPTRFNPSSNMVGNQGGYIGNSVEFPTTPGPPNHGTTDSDGNQFPVFIDPLLAEQNAGSTSYWTSSSAIMYLISAFDSQEDGAFNPYVFYPDITSIADIFLTPVPDASGVIRPGTVGTMDQNIRDYDATNKAIPEVMAELARYAGVVCCYKLTTAADSLEDFPIPQTKLLFQRRDATWTAGAKPLFLADVGAQASVSTSNVTEFHLARDCNAIVNQWGVETELRQVEVTVYLMPGFSPQTADTNPANWSQYYKSNLTNATSTAADFAAGTVKRRMYRWYVADECGDGFWSNPGGSWTTGEPLGLTKIFPNDSAGDPTYVNRYRPGSNTLISKDAGTGKPLKRILEVAKGAQTISGGPSLADTTPGAITWHTVPDGWKLLDDRLGIEVTVDNPNEWSTGEKTRLDAVGVIDKINGIEWLAKAADGDFRNFPLFRLTTVIESDQTIPGLTAPKRPASPTQFARQRNIDGKDHFQWCGVHTGSLYGTHKVMPPNPFGNVAPVRDDTTSAKTHAQQLRDAHEMPILAGSVTIPFITDYYQIGDRINIISGRDASLQTNVGSGIGEAPSYPWVTAFAWDFQGQKQSTILQFSDRRAEPQSV